MKRKTLTPRFRAAIGALALAVPFALGAAQPPQRVPARTLPKDEPFPLPIRLRTADEGGRSTPIFNNYRPQLRVSGWAGEATCTVKLGENRDLLRPGESSTVVLTCIDAVVLPEHDADKPLGLTLHEGGRTVAVGSI